MGRRRSRSISAATAVASSSSTAMGGSGCGIPGGRRPTCDLRRGDGKGRRSSGRQWPALLDFTIGGRYLRLPRRAAGEWTTTIVGRQGDGIFNQSVVVGPRVHAVFYPLRLGSDPSPLTYLTSPVDGGAHSREV